MSKFTRIAYTRGEFDPEGYSKAFSKGFAGGAAGGAAAGLLSGGTLSLPAAAAAGLTWGAGEAGGKYLEDLYYAHISVPKQISWQAGDLEDELATISKIIGSKGLSEQANSILQAGQNYKKFVDSYVKSNEAIPGSTTGGNPNAPGRSFEKNSEGPSSPYMQDSTHSPQSSPKSLEDIIYSKPSGTIPLNSAYPTNAEKIEVPNFGSFGGNGGYINDQEFIQPNYNQSYSVNPFIQQEYSQPYPPAYIPVNSLR